ncbi:MAG: hypothetical protein ACR2KV_15085 [Solirubrobacteraceae bacterium]
MNPLIQHIPHAIPVVLIWGILLRFWLTQRRLERAEAGGESVSTAPPATLVTVPEPAVRRSVALRGLMALGPLLGALATGLVIYALNLGHGQAGQAAVWTHVGLSLLALLLVVYKIADIGLARLAKSLTRGRVVRSAGSIILLALWIPLLVSGVALAIFPSTASFTAYTHLIASVWWTGLLLWHLRRYLARATRTVFARRPPPARNPAPPVSAERRPHTSSARARAATPSRRSPPRAPRSDGEAAGGADEGMSSPARGRRAPEVREEPARAGRTST